MNIIAPEYQEHNIQQTVITNGCMQVIYVSGQRASVTSPEPMRVYTEHLDIFLILDGTINLRLFNQRKALQAGDVFLCTQSTYVELHHGKQPFSYIRLRFIKEKLNGHVMPKRFAASLLDCDIIQQKILNHALSFLEFFEASCEHLSKNQAEATHQENLEILSMLEQMIIQEHESLEIIPNKLESNKLIVKAVDIFEQNIEANIQIKEVTMKLDVSHSYFVRVFKRHVGVVPNVFLRTAKINHALSLISRKMDSLCDISYLLGFADQSHFTNCFKQYLKTTPYRMTS